MRPALRALTIAASIALCGAPAGAEAPTPEAKPAPSVLPLAEAEVRVAPHGKARITLLARGDNAFVGRLEIEPGAVLPPHRDATEEYVHVLAGTGVVSIEGEESPVGPGTTVFMPAGALVSYRNGPEKAVVIQVFAGPGPSDRYGKWRPVAPRRAP